MAFTSTIKPYKFVNPSSISVKGGGATIIAGGKTITGGMTPQVKSARVTMLALNRLGMSMEGLGKTQQQIRDIIVYENKYLSKTDQFRRKRDQYRRDQKSEQQSESFGNKQKEDVKKEVVKKEKKSIGWLEKIFGPFAGIISFVGRFVITQTVLRWMGDPKNTDKLVVFVSSFSKVFKWAFNIAYKSTEAVLTGFSKVFGSSDKKGLDRFGEVLGGLGQLLIGIAGFKALGYLLNPFSLVNDIIGLVDLISGGGGGKEPRLPEGKPSTTPRAAVQKVAENYGDDAARYYDDLISRGKKPGDALKAVRGKFKKIPPKPKGLIGKIGDTFGDIRKNIGKGLGKIKGFGSNITKGMRNKLVKSGEFLKSSTQKAMQPIAKKAYDFLASKGVIKLANDLGGKAVGIIQKMPGYSKIMSKVQKEGGEAVLKKLGAKSIPVIGGLVNLYFAYDRLKNGDKSGAALEAISAILDIAGLFTGGATSALSMVLDTYLFGRDFFPDLVKGENEAFGKIINSILGPINSIKDNLPRVPFLKDGGIVNRPTRAILGENGPEAVIPLGQLGGSGMIASTIIGATQSALSRMGAAGEIAKALIGGDLNAAQNLFGVTPVKGGGGDTLGKSVMKASKGVEEIDVGNDISIFLGRENITIKDRKEPGNKTTTLRGQLANVLSALIWVSKKDIKGSTGGPSGTGTRGAPSKGGGMLPGDAPPIVKAMLDAIAAAEGGWDSVNPSTTVPGLSNMTIADARRAAIQKGKVEKGGSGAMGKWQQMPAFILERARSAGLDPNKDIFNQENQTKIARMLMAGVYPGGEKQLVIDAQENPLKAAANLRGTWPSLPGGSQENVHSKNFVSHFNANITKYAKMSKGGLLTNPRPGNGPLIENKMILKEEMNTSKFAKGGKIFLHWTAGGYQFKQPGHYHSVVQGDGTIARLHDYDDRSVSHTYKRNGTGVGLSIAAMGGNPDPWSMPPKPIQITNMAKEIANIAKSWKWKPSDINKKNVMTHAEAASLKDGSTSHDNYGPKGWGGTGERWDLWQLKKGEPNGSGGNELRAMARGFMGGDSTVKDESGASTTISPSDSNSTSGGSESIEPPETMESLFSKLQSAVSGLNQSLGYAPPKETSTDSKPVKASPKATPSASSTGKQMSDASDQVARLEEAAKDAGNYGQIIPLPINSGMTQLAYGGGTEVYTPKTPITYGI